jgi:hypothetical protein
MLTTKTLRFGWLFTAFGIFTYGGCGITDNNIGSVNGALNGDPCSDLGKPLKAATAGESCLCLNSGKANCVSLPSTCEKGDKKEAADGCNSCVCDEQGLWACTEMACGGKECVPGQNKAATDGCNTCACNENGSWSCTEKQCGGPPIYICAPGETKNSSGCSCTCNENSNGWVCSGESCDNPPKQECTVGETMKPDCVTCTCVKSPIGTGTTWSCPAVVCPKECPPPVEPDPNEVCDQVVVWAREPLLGGCCEYQTPCHAPKGWAQYGTQSSCDSEELVCPPPTKPDPNMGCNQVVVWSKDPVSGGCCVYPTPCEAPAGWKQFSNQQDCEAGM